MVTPNQIRQIPDSIFVEQSSAEELLSVFLAEVRRLLPTLNLRETDPLYQLANQNSGYASNRRAEDNERAKQLLIRYAKGANLDNLVVLNGIIRKDGEGDGTLLARALLEPFTRSAVGSEVAIRGHCLQASEAVLDRNDDAISNQIACKCDPYN